MFQLEYVKSNNVVLGLVLTKDNDPIIKVALPDRYVGDGNDIAEAVLMILFHREREKLTDLDLRIEISQFLIGQIYSDLAPSDDGDNWGPEDDDDPSAWHDLRDDDFYYHYTP